MKSFREYLREAKGDTITITFGRFNPPTVGHGKLLDAVKKAAGSGQYRVYASKAVDKKKNPLGFENKIKMMRKMFPVHARNIVKNAPKNPLQALEEVYKEGYTNVNFIAGSDRVPEYQKLFDRYNGDGPKDLFNFDEINVISAGERDPDSDGAEGMSATKLRNAAKSHDFDSFKMGLPEGFAEAEELYKLVRDGLGVVDIEPASDVREAYVSGDLVDKGDLVECNGVRGKVLSLGSNYIFVEFVDGTKKRKWLTDIVKIEEAAKTFQAPAAARKAAQKALDWKEEHGDEVTAMTRTGWARANQLAKNKPLSLETVKRMAAFERHRSNAKISPELKDTPWKDNGYVAWLGWGGDAGIKWAKGVVEAEKSDG